MLTVKEINEVSFGKASFSGYKAEDVDNFIDEVVESFTQLQAERDDALQQNAQLSDQLNEVNGQINELKSKNAELQKKLGILAQKIESYREEEDGIKEAILSAQRIAKESIKEAQGKAAVMVADAEESAKRILANARDDAARAAREYAEQVDRKRSELEEMKRQVSAFRVSLLEMYKKHLESINHIPSFRIKETPPTPAAAQQPESRPAPEPAPAPQPEPEPEPLPEPEPEPELVEEAPAVQPEPQPVPRRSAEPSSPAPRSLHDKVDLSEEQTAPYLDDDLSQVGIDLTAYSDIPESLKREKESNFSNLEFGDNVDLGKKKRRK